jgi:uncharacterized membrane protein
MNCMRTIFVMGLIIVIAVALRAGHDSMLSSRWATIAYALLGADLNLFIIVVLLRRKDLWCGFGLCLQ